MQRARKMRWVTTHSPIISLAHTFSRARPMPRAKALHWTAPDCTGPHQTHKHKHSTSPEPAQARAVQVQKRTRCDGAKKAKTCSLQRDPDAHR